MKSYWREIEAMGWGKSSVNYAALSREFYAKWGKRKMQTVRRFVGIKIGELYNRVGEWEKAQDKCLDIGSDDGFSDVLAHTVGLGEKTFNAVMANPVLLEKRYNSKYGSKEGYTESFSYAFHEPEPDKPKVPVWRAFCHKCPNALFAKDTEHPVNVKGILVIPQVLMGCKEDCRVTTFNADTMCPLRKAVTS